MFVIACAGSHHNNSRTKWYGHYHAFNGTWCNCNCQYYHFWKKDRKWQICNCVTINLGSTSAIETILSFSWEWRIVSTSCEVRVWWILNILIREKKLNSDKIKWKDSSSLGEMIWDILRQSQSNKLTQSEMAVKVQTYLFCCTSIYSRQLITLICKDLKNVKFYLEEWK